MRIAYFTDTFLPQINGIATYIANFSKELGKRGHKVQIFTPDAATKNKKFEARNVTVNYLPSFPVFIYPDFRLGAFGFPKILTALHKFNPDIIHFHTPLFVGMDGVVMAKLLKKPLVGTLQIFVTSTDHLRWLKNESVIDLTAEILEQYSKYLYDKCDLMLVPSYVFISELKKAGFKAPIEYFPNAIDTTAFSKNLTEKRKAQIKQKLKLKEKVILHCGRISGEKRVDILIEAFAKVLKHVNNVSLLIIGDGPSKKEAEELVQRLNIKENIVFTGFIQHEKLMTNGYLDVCDIFASASPMEVQPMVVLEAMSFGLPILAVKAAGIVELVEESKNGFLVSRDNASELAEKMLLLLQDDALTNKMRRESLKLANNFSIEKVTDSLINKYQYLINHKQPHDSHA